MWSLYFNRACKALHTMAHVTLAFFLLLDQSTRTLPCPWSFVLFLCDHSLPSTKSAQMRPSLATLSIKPPLVYFSSLLCFPFSSQHLTAWHIILTCSQSISLEHKLCLVQPGSPVLRTVHTGGETGKSRAKTEDALPVGSSKLLKQMCILVFMVKVCLVLRQCTHNEFKCN